MEKKQGLKPMIRSTRKGRQVLAAKKLMLGITTSVVVFGPYAGIRMGSIGLTYGYDLLTAPAHSLMQFGQSICNLPIWLTLAGLLVSQWLVFGLVSAFVCLLTHKIGMIGSMMIGVVVSLGTAVQNVFVLPFPTIWNLLEQNSLINCCVLLSLMVAFWRITVRLWSENVARTSGTLTVDGADVLKL